MKHTPGPWSQQRNIANYRSGRTALEVRGPSDELIATFPGCDRDKHNANIISHAPELLQALKQMLDAFYHDPLGGGQDAAVEAALRAVAKAQGEK